MAFHPYPQVIPQFFNTGGFGPPRSFTHASACPWIAHTASCLRQKTQSPYSDSVSLRLRVLPLNLAFYRNSQVHYTKSTPSPILERKRAPTACRHTVSGPISLPSRGSFHLSLTVLVHYRSPRVFSLGRWPSQVPIGFHVSGGTQVPDRSSSVFVYGAITLCGAAFQLLQLTSENLCVRPYNPAGI